MTRSMPDGTHEQQNDSELGSAEELALLIAKGQPLRGGHSAANIGIKALVVIFVLVALGLGLSHPILLVYSILLLVNFCWIPPWTGFLIPLLIGEVAICHYGLHYLVGVDWNWLLDTATLSIPTWGRVPLGASLLMLATMFFLLCAGNRLGLRDIFCVFDYFPPSIQKNQSVLLLISFTYIITNFHRPLSVMKWSMRARGIPLFQFRCQHRAKEMFRDRPLRLRLQLRAEEMLRGLALRVLYIFRELRITDVFIQLLVANRVHFDRRKSFFSGNLNHADHGLLFMLVAMLLAIADTSFHHSTHARQTTGQHNDSEPALPHPPRSTVEGLVADLVIDHDQLHTPTGIKVDSLGRLWVLENRTHFLLDKGSASDRVLVFSAPGKDGKCELLSEFADGLQNSMGLELVGDSVYVVCSRQIIQLTDHDANLRADSRREVVRFVSDSLLQLKGLSGFAYRGGKLFFGLGENFNHPCRLEAGGESIALRGDTGGIFELDITSERIRQVANGFWRPFAMSFLESGALLAADNDPNWSPCRLLHIVEGGDYGYRFSERGYKRQPLSAWNGEMPGTLPMIASTSEAPTGVLECLSAQFPSELQNKVLVSCWGGHRVEYFDLKPRGVSWTSEKKPLLQGGVEFRPVAISAAPDGTIYVTDWVEAPYGETRRGRIWRIRGAGKTVEAATTRLAVMSENVNLAVAVLPKGEPSAHLRDYIRSAFISDDPFLLSSACSQAGLELPADELSGWLNDVNPKIRVGALLSLGRKKGYDVADLPWAQIVTDTDLRVIQAGLMLIKARKVAAALPIAATAVMKWRSDPEIMEAAVSALEWSFGDGRAGDELWNQVLAAAAAPGIEPKAALAMLSGSRQVRRRIPEEILEIWAASDDVELSQEAISIVAMRATNARPLISILANVKSPQRIADIVSGLGRFSESDPSVRDTLEKFSASPDQVVAKEALRSLRVLNAKGAKGGEWISFADQPMPLAAIIATDGNMENGRRVFVNPHAGDCLKCHVWEGLGGRVGHDLTGLPQLMARMDVLDAVLNPSREIAPQYVTWEIRTAQKTVIGTLLEEKPDSLTLGTPTGEEIVVGKTEIVSKKTRPESLCSPSARNRLSVEDLRDLATFLGGMD